VLNAIAREKHLKHWTRAQKIALIESTNPTWEDLSVTLWPDLPTPKP
jgi:putative endonuclease